MPSCRPRARKPLPRRALFHPHLKQVDRRVFILGSAAARALAAQTPAPSAVDPNRRVYGLNRGWLYGDSSEKVTLPHANVRLPWHSFDEKAFQFVSVYQRHFQALTAWTGKRVFVDFGGAMAAATVSVNGHKFPEYRGGYTPFSFELTPHLNFGGDNLLIVELDSTERKD